MLQFGLLWARITNFAILFLLYAIILAYLGYFSTTFLLVGLLIIGYLTGAFAAVFKIVKNILNDDLDIIGLFIFLGCSFWLVFLLLFSPFPAFSGRDEGSYANAAIYISQQDSYFLQLPLLKYLKNEGPARQLLNFPGFVAQGD